MFKVSIYKSILNINLEALSTRKNKVMNQKKSMRKKNSKSAKRKSRTQLKSLRDKRQKKPMSLNVK